MFFAGPARREFRFSCTRTSDDYFPFTGLIEFRFISIEGVCYDKFGKASFRKDGRACALLDCAVRGADYVEAFTALVFTNGVWRGNRVETACETLLEELEGRAAHLDHNQSRSSTP